MSYTGIIPQDRPIIGKDLDEVRQSLGLIVADACNLFGLSMTRWMQHVRQAAELEIKDPALSSLVRLYDAHPELCPIPKMPHPQELHDLMTKIRGPLTKAEFAAAFGAESTATYRWLKQGAAPSPYAARLMLGLKQLLLSSPEGRRAEVLEEWMSVVEAEGRARGGDQSPAKSGKWYTAQLMQKREEKEKGLVGNDASSQSRKKGRVAKQENSE